jgi:glutamate formiminotransferase/formiminotetrahydrofolate cyclodeaminase
MMVAGLTKSRHGSDEDRIALSEARASLTAVRERLIALADTDAEAFNRVMAAYRLPNASDADKAARKDAIQQGLKAATAVPLDTLEAATDGLRLGRSVKAHGNPAADSDVDVGIGLLRAAADGAEANVRINLESVQDPAFTEATLAGVARCRSKDQ